MIRHRFFKPVAFFLPAIAASALVFGASAERAFAFAGFAAQEDTNTAIADAPAAFPDGPRRVMVEASNRATILHVPVGRSLVLTTDVALRRVYVGDPKVLHSFASGAKEDVITARMCGVSTLLLWDAAGGRRMYTVYADLDTDGLSRAIADAMPDANVSVSAKTSRVYLAGTVSSDAAADAVGKLAAIYSKDVVNGVRVLAVHSRQIELKLRIVEIDRSRMQQYGLNFFALGGSALANTSTQQFSSTAASGPPVTISDPLNILLFSSKLNAGVTIKDLEQKQILQVLAEPTLTTLSGIAARFLSGGEFPLPVVQGGTGNSTAITIVWKPYGVKVDFTPTSNADGTIRLKIAPEVSTLDYTNAVTISGFTVPALSTRRAETEVELQSGQSFILSGLLDHRTTDNLSRMPGIANIPILGQLFRSKGMTLTTVDLVVVVTATLVDPLSHSQTIVEPKMILPNLDKQHFDRDVNKEHPAETGTASAPADDPVDVPSPAATPASGSDTGAAAMTPAGVAQPMGVVAQPVLDLAKPDSDPADPESPGSKPADPEPAGPENGSAPAGPASSDSASPPPAPSQPGQNRTSPRGSSLTTMVKP
jgi:pilus assembly protein CpaC